MHYPGQEVILKLATSESTGLCSKENSHATTQGSDVNLGHKQARATTSPAVKGDTNLLTLSC